MKHISNDQSVKRMTLSNTIVKKNIQKFRKHNLRCKGILSGIPHTLN